MEHRRRSARLQWHRAVAADDADGALQRREVQREEGVDIGGGHAQRPTVEDEIADRGGDRGGELDELDILAGPTDQPVARSPRTTRRGRLDLGAGRVDDRRGDEQVDALRISLALPGVMASAALSVAPPPVPSQRSRAGRWPRPQRGAPA